MKCDVISVVMSKRVGSLLKDKIIGLSLALLYYRSLSRSLLQCDVISMVMSNDTFSNEPTLFSKFNLLYLKSPEGQVVTNCSVHL